MQFVSILFRRQVIGKRFTKRVHVMELFILFDNGSHGPILELFDLLFYTHSFEHYVCILPTTVIKPLTLFLFRYC